MTMIAAPTSLPAFERDDFRFAFELALGATYRGCADVGEVLATASRIADGDADVWLQEWTGTAGAVWAAACEADEAGRCVTALAHYRRAATYYATGQCLLEHASEIECARRPELWHRQRACWERIVDLSPVPGERIAVAYEDTTLAAFFFRAPGAASGERRPLVVINNGSDGATSQMWLEGGAAAAERGYHWMTFDGPGQQSARFDQGLPFRPDWEAVLTPVLDAMVARPDVDHDRVAVIGAGQAGFWVARALAFEHRFAAAVADPGVVDVSTMWTEALPGVMVKQLADGNREAFDREMHVIELLSSEFAATLRSRGAPYGLGEGSRFALYREVARYRLGDEIAQITTPLLITEPEGEQFWPGQSQQLHDRLSGPRELMPFSSAEGAGRHGEPLARGQRDARIYDWLDRYLAGAPAARPG